MDWHHCSYDQAISALLKEKKLSVKDANEINYNLPSTRSYELLRSYIDLAPFARNSNQFLLQIAERMELNSTRDMELIKNMEKFDFDGSVALFVAFGELLERVDARMLPKGLSSDQLLAHEKDKRELEKLMLLTYHNHGPTFDLIEYVKSFAEVLCDPSQFAIASYEIVNKDDVVAYLIQYYQREASDREFDSNEQREAWVESKANDAYKRYPRMMLTSTRLKDVDQHRKDVIVFKVKTVLVEKWKHHIRNLPPSNTYGNSVIAMIKAGQPPGYVRGGACLSCTFFTPEAHQLRALCKHSKYHRKHDVCPVCMSFKSPHQLSMCKLTRSIFSRAPYRENWASWDPQYDPPQEKKFGKNSYNKQKGKDSFYRSNNRSGRLGRDSSDQSLGGNSANSNDNSESVSKGSDQSKSDRTKVKPKKEEKRT